MVATIKSISSAKNTSKYFYFTEKNFECNKEWYASEITTKLGFQTLKKQDFENILSGKLVFGDNVIELGRKENNKLKHHPGQELILSAPKSVSIVALIGEDTNVITAHNNAVDAILKYIEANIIYTRIQANGILSLTKSNNIIAAKFTHQTSRSGKDLNTAKDPDPQLHTHCIIANITQCDDNKWRSIVFDKLYENKMHIGELYRMELAYNLEKLGYKITLTQDKSCHWNFEIEGIPQKDIEEFSQRRKNILEIAETLGKKDAVSLTLIAKSSRKEKMPHNLDELKGKWRQRISSLAIFENIKTHIPQEINKIKIFDESLKNIITFLSQQESSWSKEKIIELLIFNTKNQLNIEEIQTHINNAIKTGKLLQYNNSSFLTTAHNIKIEKQIIKLMLSMQNKVKNIMTHIPKIDNVTQGQLDAISLVLTTKDQITGIQGYAGTGKTTVLRNIKDILPNYELIGLTQTKSAANVLQQTAEIKTYTLDLFLMRYKGILEFRATIQGKKEMQKYFKDKIIVLDEASLVPNSKMKLLLILAQELKFRLIISGDMKQMGAIEAGKPFQYLQENGMKTAIIHSIQRQQNHHLLQGVYTAEASIEANKPLQQIYQAFKYIKKENIIDLANEKNVTNNIIADKVYEIWNKNKNALIIVPSNPLKNVINNKIRNHYTIGENIEHKILIKKTNPIKSLSTTMPYEKGDILYFNKRNQYYEISDINPNIISQIKKNDVELYNKSSIQIAVGDQLKWTKNSKKNSFIINGNTCNVEKINKKNIVLKTQNNEIKKLNLNDPDLQHIDYGYTSTIYSAQGKTSSNVIAVLKAREPYINLTNQRSFYVAISRAKHNITLITDNYNNLLKKLSIKTGAKTSALDYNQEISFHNKNYIKKPPHPQELNVKLDSIPINLQEQYQNIIFHIKDIKAQISLLQTNVLSQTYQNPKTALKLLYKLLLNNDPRKIIMHVVYNPQILGKLFGISILNFTNQARKNAINHLVNEISTLIQLSNFKTTLKEKEIMHQNMNQNFHKKYLSEISQFNSKNQNYQELICNLEPAILLALKATDNITNPSIIQKIQAKISTNIIEYRSHFNKEPNSVKKKEFFLRARYEISRKNVMQQYLKKISTPQTTGDTISLNQKLDRYLAIDSRISFKKNIVYFTPKPLKIITNIYNQGEEKIHNLTQEFIQQNIKLIQANFIATEIVKYEEKYGEFMPLKQQKYVMNVAKYVDMKYNALIKSGATKNEAKVVYNECVKIIAQRINPHENNAMKHITQNIVSNNQKHHNKQLDNHETKYNKQQMQL